MTDDRDDLLRLLSGEMPEAEADVLRARLAREPELRARLDRLETLQADLAAARPDGFAPFFSARVMDRLTAAPQAVPGEALYDALRWAFARTAVAGLVAAGALGTFNVLDYQALGVAASALEALFGLPSATLGDALSYSAL